MLEVEKLLRLYRRRRKQARANWDKERDPTERYWVGYMRALDGVIADLEALRDAGDD